MYHAPQRAENSLQDNFEVVFIYPFNIILEAVGLVGKTHKMGNRLKPGLLVNASVVQVHYPPRQRVSIHRGFLIYM